MANAPQHAASFPTGDYKRLNPIFFSDVYTRGLKFVCTSSQATGNEREGEREWGRRRDGVQDYERRETERAWEIDCVCEKSRDRERQREAETDTE